MSVFGLWWCRWGVGLEEWCGVKSVWVVSPDSLCRWQVHVSVYCV